MAALTEPPEGIILTISAKMLKERGLITWLKQFHKSMNDEHCTYWFRAGAKPKYDKLLYIYLCIGNKIRYRINFVSAEAGGERTFTEGHSDTARAWIVACGPITKPCIPIKHKGFRGFRYTHRLF